MVELVTECRWRLCQYLGVLHFVGAMCWGFGLGWRTQHTDSCGLSNSRKSVLSAENLGGEKGDR